MTIKRITKDALFLAILCLGGMLSIPLGDNIKVSLQILLVFIIALLSDSFIDALIITSLYLLMGLFMPIYAGFNSGITPTFGYVISFILITIPIYFINKIKALPEIVRIIIGCTVGLLIAYVIGSVFMYLYFNYSLNRAFTVEKVLMISVVPYIPFDIAKIAIATVVVKLIPNKFKNASKVKKVEDAPKDDSGEENK